MDLDELMTRLQGLVAAQETHDGASVEADSSTNFDCVGCEGCSRCRFCAACRDCDDCTYCEECVECVSCTHAQRSVDCGDSSHLRDCRGCVGSRYLTLCVECEDCTYCLGCVGLAGAEFHVLNAPVTRGTFFKLAKALHAELEVRTHLGWRPDVVGIEAPTALEDDDNDAGTEDGGDVVETATDAATADPQTVWVEPTSAEMTFDPRMDEVTRPRPTPARTPETPEGDAGGDDRDGEGVRSTSPGAGTRGAGWISAIADGLEDDADSQVPEMTHTGMVEPRRRVDPAYPGVSPARRPSSVGGRRPGGLSLVDLDDLDDLDGRDDVSQGDASGGARRLPFRRIEEDAPSPSGDVAASRGARPGTEGAKAGGEGRGLDPLGAVGGPSFLDGLRARSVAHPHDASSEPAAPVDTNAGGAPLEAAPPSPRAEDDGERRRGRLTRGRRPARPQRPEDDVE